MAVLVFAAGVLAIPRQSWKFFGVFTTLVHELGHAFVGALFGRRVTGITVHANHGGSARSLGRGGLGSVVSGFFGYPAPAVVGAVLLWCVFMGYTAPAFAAGTLVTILTLIFIRNWFGALAVVVSAGISALLWIYGTSAVQSYALLIIGVALLIGSVRAFFSVVSVHTRRRGSLASSDAYLLAQRTRIPSAVWLFGFALVIGGSVYFAAQTYISTQA
jgi:hypothetical protein